MYLVVAVTGVYTPPAPEEGCEESRLFHYVFPGWCIATPPGRTQSMFLWRSRLWRALFHKHAHFLSHPNTCHRLRVRAPLLVSKLFAYNSKCFHVTRTLPRSCKTANPIKTTYLFESHIDILLLVISLPLDVESCCWSYGSSAAVDFRVVQWRG